MNRSEATPFIKWVGGKRKIAKEITEYFPEKIEKYYEPFLGGGAIYFHIHYRIDKAVLSDINQDLINAYIVLAYFPLELLGGLKIIQKTHRMSESFFYDIRDWDPDFMSPLEQACRFIYLNKHCFRGMYRVNKQGKFNVGFAKQHSLKEFDYSNLKACSKALEKAVFTPISFERLEIEKTDNTVVYCDPPYDGTYDKYTFNGFSKDMHKKLRDKVIEWGELGAKVIVSNSNTEYIRKLYSDKRFTIREIQAQRPIAIGTKSKKRVKNLIILNFPH